MGVPGASSMGAWCLVPGACCLLPGACCLVPQAWACLVPQAWAPGAWCQRAPAAWCLKHGRLLPQACAPAATTVLLLNRVTHIHTLLTDNKVPPPALITLACIKRFCCRLPYQPKHPHALPLAYTPAVPVPAPVQVRKHATPAHITCDTPHLCTCPHYVRHTILMHLPYPTPTLMHLLCPHPPSSHLCRLRMTC